MLKRIYIDNYKSLVNFEVSLNEINLFLGVNGAGKSAVFEMLRKVKCLVAGDSKVIELFSFENCTRRQNSLLQAFELDTRVRSTSADNEDALTVSELVARGWLNE